MRHIARWRAIVYAASLFPLCVHAQPVNEEFASNGTSAEPCHTAYMACAAERRLETSTNERYRAAGQRCHGDLQQALAKEDELNSQLPQLATLTGQARTDYNTNTVQPTIQARGEAIAAFNDCTRQAMEDLRPADYPKSDVLLAGGVTNSDDVEPVLDDLDRMVAESAANAMYNGGRFMQGVLDWANETATFLAQEPGKPLEQIVTGTGTFAMETVPAYLMNNNAENHAKLYAAAEKAIEDFQKDPAYAIGHAAPNAIPVGALSRAKALASLKRTTGALKRLTQRQSLPGGLEPGVRSEIAKRPPKASTPGGDYGAGPPPGTDGFPLDRPPSADTVASPSRPVMGPDDVSPPPSDAMERFPLNPYPACDNNCFTTQIANDLREYYKQPFQASSGNLGTLENQWALLRNLYGGANAKNPYHGQGGLQRMAAGLPVKSSPSQIDRALERAAKNERFTDVNGNLTEPAPRGMVYVEYSEGFSHAFDAKWDAKLGRTVFGDATQEVIKGMGLFDGAERVWFYRQR
jgi:hypothetical protein